MKQSNHMIENRLKRAIESSVPNVLPGLLEQIKEKEELSLMNQTKETSKVIPLPEQKKRPALRWQRALIPIAAAFILLIGGWLAYANLATQAIIGFDVNPSVELSVNRSEKILQVNPRNEEGEAVIGSMQLKGVDLDVAVNALIGSMVKNGYIDDIKNSILITVDSRDTAQGVRLQKRLSDEVSELLSGFSLQGAVLSQTSRADRHYKELAEEHGISPGKAALIEQLVKSDPTIGFTDVASLSINDINLLISARQADLEGVNLTGTASRKAYIGEEKAKLIALEHAGLSEKDVSKLEVELDFDDGRMIYEVEFNRGTVSYDYEIDAKNGQILEFKSKDKGGATTPTDKPGQYIGGREAEAIALTHAGLSRDKIRKLETELESEKGKVFYEVEFEHSGYEYEYEIDAVTGKILDVEVEKIKGGGGSTQPTTSARTSKATTQATTRQTTAGQIGVTKAEDIAFKHAGLKRSQVKKLETELEREGGRLIYEVEFEYDGYEYEYEIDAQSGKILDVEIEKIKSKSSSRPAPTSAAKDQMIGRDQAGQIALKKAGLTRAQVSQFEIELKDKKTPPYYEVEFKYQGYEYEYEIHALTGEILEEEIERD